MDRHLVPLTLGEGLAKLEGTGLALPSQMFADPWRRKELTATQAVRRDGGRAEPTLPLAPICGIAAATPCACHVIRSCIYTTKDVTMRYY